MIAYWRWVAVSLIGQFGAVNIFKKKSFGLSCISDDRYQGFFYLLLWTEVRRCLLCSNLCLNLQINKLLCIIRNYRGTMKVVVIALCLIGLVCSTCVSWDSFLTFLSSCSNICDKMNFFRRPMMSMSERSAHQVERSVAQRSVLTA